MKRVMQEEMRKNGAGSADGRIAGHLVRSVRRTAYLAAAAIALVLLVFGVLFVRATRVPDDRDVDAKLARVQEALAKKRAESPAGLADRIAQAPFSRRTQEQLLRETEESGIP